MPSKGYTSFRLPVDETDRDNYAKATYAWELRIRPSRELESEGQCRALLLPAWLYACSTFDVSMPPPDVYYIPDAKESKAHIKDHAVTLCVADRLTLLHELSHLIVGIPGHGRRFRSVALALYERFLNVDGKVARCVAAELRLSFS